VPKYRFIIEGSEIITADRCVGFFTVRSATAINETIASARLLQLLSEEWAIGESAHLSNRKPNLKIVDCWKPRLLDRFRQTPEAGHSLYGDDGGRPSAASLEAKVARAPRHAAIWKIAAETTA
jgi:hypothetical protein